MADDLLIIEAFMWIDLKQTAEHVSRLLRDVVLESVYSPENEAVQLLHAGSLKGHGAVQHGVEDHACTPEVDPEAVLVLVPQNLWGDVGWRPALVTHFDSWGALLADTEVCDLDLALAIQQYIVELDVSMGYILRVNIPEPVDYLLEDLLRDRLLQAPPLPHVVQKVTARTQLHYDDDVLLGLDGLVYLHYVVMTQLQQQIYFFHELLLLDFVREALLVERFEGYELSHQLVHGEVDLSEGATSKHFSDPVEVQRRLRCLLLGFEGIADLLHDEGDFLGPWAQLLNLLIEKLALLVMLFDYALRPQDLAEECFLVDVAGDLPDLRLVLFCNQRPIWHVQVRQVSLMPRYDVLA